MAKNKKIIAISGSTRQSSANLSLISAITQLYSDKLNFNIFQNIANLPHFNPDLDNENAPQPVIDFRMQMDEADGILICTPEYAMGVPGTLKNAIDWTVSSLQFSHKPTVLITAGLSGLKGHRALMETLNILEADIPESLQLIISFAKTKVSGNTITDTTTLEQVKQVIDSLKSIIDLKKTETHL